MPAATISTMSTFEQNKELWPCKCTLNMQQNKEDTSTLQLSSNTAVLVTGCFDSGRNIKQEISYETKYNLETFADTKLPCTCISEATIRTDCCASCGLNDLGGSLGCVQCSETVMTLYDLELYGSVLQGLVDELSTMSETLVRHGVVLWTCM